MSSRRARVDSLTDDLSTLSDKVSKLYDDLEAAVEEIEADGSADRTRADEDTDRSDGGNVGWEEVETAGPDGDEAVEQVEWTPVE